MTSERLLSLVKTMYPTEFDDEILLMWLSQCENSILTEILLVSELDCKEYSEASQEPLLVPHPYDKLYLPYMQAQACFANGETDKYANHMQLYNTYRDEYARWVCAMISPGYEEAIMKGYYLSAYAIARAHGYRGTEEEWLNSLRGPAGKDGLSAYDIAVKNGFEGTRQDWLDYLKGPQGPQGIPGLGADPAFTRAMGMIDEGDICGIPIHDNISTGATGEYGILSVVRTVEEEENPGFVEVPSLEKVEEMAGEYADRTEEFQEQSDYTGPVVYLRSLGPGAWKVMDSGSLYMTKIMDSGAGTVIFERIISDDGFLYDNILLNGELIYSLSTESGEMSIAEYRVITDRNVQLASDEDESGGVEVPSVGKLREMLGDGSVSAKTAREQEHAVLGDELVSAEGWTAEGWTGDFASGFTHTIGNTNRLVFTMPVSTAGKLFQIEFQVTFDDPQKRITTTNLFVQIGNSELFNLYGQADPINVGVLALEDGNLEFIPEGDFAGTLTDISIREIIGVYSGSYIIRDSDGNESFAIRTNKVSKEDSQNGENNLFLGVKSGQTNTSGYGNLAAGNEALENNTSGFWNVGLGYKALESNTAGSRNIGIGYVALRNNQVGQRNIAIGTHALREHATGDFNIAIGADAQLEGTEGEGNIGIGVGALYKNSGGNYNTAIGCGALGGGTLGSRGENNVGIGKYTMPGVTGSDNICLGRQAGYNLTNGSDNVFIGVNAAKNASGAKRSLVIGASSGQNITSGSDLNVIIGNYTGNDITTGVGNITIGAGLNGAGSDTPRKYNSYWLNIGGLVKGYIYPDAAMRYMLVDGGLELPGIPTVDPQVAGRVWNDNGTLKISGGAA